MGPYSVLKKLSLLSIFSRFEILQEFAPGPFGKATKKATLEKPDNFEDLPKISKYQSGKKIFEGSAKNHTLKHTINWER